MAAVIYAICCPDTDNVVYIGRTLNCYERFSQHKNNKENTLIGIWMRELIGKGKSANFKILETFENIPITHRERYNFCMCVMDAREWYWISYHIKNGADLLNMKRGRYPEKLNIA